MDAWSYDKTVILDNDIVLDERAEDFLPIPTFGGTFEGGGHTISGLSIIGEDSNVGLFDTLQQSAVVNHLKVVGQIMPNGTSNSIGGIVGTNYGKLVDCSFEGAVKGDDSVAGIVGSISVEYDFDPEDDLTEEGSHSLDFQYRTLAVVTGCTNEGSISAKKDYAGGIVGRMDLGAVKACESYGEVESTSGDYVGGIAGIC